MDQSVGDKVHQARIRKGWSQERLGVEAGTSQTAIKNLENGTVKHPRALSRILALLDIDDPSLTAVTSRLAADRKVAARKLRAMAKELRTRADELEASAKWFEALGDT